LAKGQLLSSMVAFEEDGDDSESVNEVSTDIVEKNSKGESAKLEKKEVEVSKQEEAQTE
jgi:hypothetical protein